MTNSRFAIAALPALGFLLFFDGCQMAPPKPWHLSASKEGDTVKLCISKEATCPQPGGIGVDSISVYRYDNTHDNQLIWDTSSEGPESNEKFDGVVTYGVPPKGWHNKMTPPALACGKAYLVNPPALLFGLKCDGSVVVLDFPQLESFFR
jgi:hypothetical protein